MNFDIYLYIDSQLISSSLIANEITVRRKENESALMVFTLITAEGVQDINAYTGKSVELDIISDSVNHRLFTGTIDYPVVDLIGKRMTFQCSTNRIALINSLVADNTIDLNTVGYWSDAVFNVPDTSHDELQQRLKTTPLVLDFDAYNEHSFNSIEPKDTPDFTLEDSDIFYRQPSVRVVESSEIYNHIDVTFAFRYSRHRHRERQYKIGKYTACEVWFGLGQWVKLDDAIDLAVRSGWVIDMDSVNFQPMPATGTYTCFGSQEFIWYNLNDPNIWVLNVSFNAAYRFGQTIVETYNIDVKAPQSITQYGEKKTAIVHGLDVEADDDTWELNESYIDTTGLTQDVDSGDYYTDVDGTDFANAAKTAINMAKTTILRSHRKNVVDFETYLFPNLELNHTVKVDTDEVVATGKVQSIEHTIDITNRIGFTRTEIAFSTAQGTQTSDDFVEPTRIDTPLTFSTSSATYTYDHDDVDFITPEIDSASRLTQEVEADYTYNIEIPNSSLTVTF